MKKPTLREMLERSPRAKESRDATGMTIIRAILEGERNPEVLAQHRDPRCKNSSDVIAKSLVGNYREEHLFALQQAVTLYDTYQSQLAAVDQQYRK